MHQMHEYQKRPNVRLNHVKENDLVHSEWEKWCENVVEITPQYANKYIKVFQEFKYRNTSFNLGVNALYLISTLPEPDTRK